VILLVYPFLLAYYPIFALRNHNIEYVDLATVLRSLLLATAGTAILAVIAYLLVRNLEKSSLIVSGAVILFFSYGHLYAQYDSTFGSPIRHRYLAGAQLLVFFLVTVLVLKKERLTRMMSQFMAAGSLVLLAIVLLVAIRYDLGEYRAAAAAVQSESANAPSQPSEQLSDFYLIVLDAHTRSDVLQERFGYDNGDFVDQLTAMGFYISSCSQSNYASTKLSLTSALYADYIQEIVPQGQVLPPLKSSAVSQALKSRGYKTIAFENRTRGHFDLKEDVRLSRNRLAFGEFDLRGGVSEFEKMMVDTSFLRFLLNTELVPGFDLDALEDWELQEHYYQTQYILSELENMPAVPGAKFVFAHIMVPHAPFVFSPDGEYRPTSDPIKGYRDNVEFIDRRLPSVLSAIIENSDQPPIIVVMGDHGPATRKTITEQMRMATLNAYFVNAAAKEQMYPTLTPVNAFRIILNAHYGGNYPLLEDRSYYAYKTDQVPGAEIIETECVGVQ
jgi:predicted aspartyl protease